VQSSVATPSLRTKIAADTSGAQENRSLLKIWLRGRDLNPRPSGYEPDELPGCSTPRFDNNFDIDAVQSKKHLFDHSEVK
jgi:hypothetical protein